MRLKNNALQELYDALLYGPVISSPYAESPIDMAFKECDEKLSESATFKCIKDLQHRCDNLERSNKALRDDNDKLGDKVIKLNKERDAKDKENSALISANADLSDRLDKVQKKCERIDRCWTVQIQDGMELNKKISALQKEKDELESQYQKLTIENKRLQDDTIGELKKELDNTKKLLNYYKHCYYDLGSRAHRAEDEVEDLKKRIAERQKKIDILSADLSDGWRSRAMQAEKRVEDLVNVNDNLTKKVVALQKEKEAVEKDRDFYFNKYQELKKDYETVTVENRRLNARTDCLREEVKWYRMHYKWQSDKILELKKRLNSVYGTATCTPDKNVEETEKSRKCYRQIHVGEGARHLWGMLQNVNNALRFELVTCFPDVTGVEDILSWDLDDFLDAYKKWQEEKEQKEIDRMRNWLAGFCDGKYCGGCPLGSEEYKCGRGYSFKKANQSGTRIIPDEDIKRYYEKARGDGDKTFFFDNQPVTMEVTVEVDKDLLNTVCGIKPKEEEHKLEYGDAVRVPWRDYDYMYIGPEDKHIRLFNPKTHTVVSVSTTENLTYQGCKIVLYNEDDIRKIWKDKK